MDKTPLYNSIIIKTYIDYLASAYPSVNIEELLAFSDISNYELEDQGHWFTQNQVNRFQEYVTQALPGRNIAREAGRHIASPSASRIIRQSIAGFISPSIAYWAIEKLGASISRHQTMKINKISNNKIEIIAAPHKNVKEESFQCENRFGMFEAVTEVFTNKYAEVEHPECIHKGGNCCRYIISWEQPKSFFWRRISYYSFAMSLITAIPLFFFLDFIYWSLFFLLALLISVGFSIISYTYQSKEMTTNLAGQGKVSDELIEQINLRYNELLLIREISEGTSNILDPAKLLLFITESLQKRLQFNRCMIMLANPEKTKLVYTAGYGHTEEEELLLKNIDFNLTNPHSKGIFYLAYRDQKPYLINNVEDIENNLSGKSASFIKKLGINAFICVPIIYEGRSEGILAVDNTRSKNRPTQSDLSLLMGIAPQIGISLNNAIAHKKLKESEERFRNISDNAPDVIYRLDASGQFTYVNPAWEKLSGCNIEETTGINFTDFLHQQERETFSSAVKSIIASKAILQDHKFNLVRKNGGSRQIVLTGAPDLDSEGNVIGIMGTLKDVTRLRVMEEQLMQAAKMEAVGTLTGGIAHDFNNIIQAIMGYNQLLMMENRGNKTERLYLANIEKLIQRSIDLIRQLLFFSKKSDPLTRVVNINDEIRNMQKLLGKSIPKMIEIKTELADDIFPINADSIQMSQIVMNLVINARDAISDSGVIKIKTRNLTFTDNTAVSGFTMLPGNYIEVSVSDNGSSMDNEVMEHIFEPFYTTKEAGKGTGLGLSIVYSIVRNHDGVIYCESEKGKGTSFIILLPAASSEQEKQPISTQAELLIGGRETILLVDDEKSILEIGKDYLERYGYKVMTAGNGEEAVDIYQRLGDKINLVILDLIMPGRGGKKCLLDLLKINPGIKVLMASGFANAAQEEELIKAGAAAFLHKPYQPDDFIIAIRNIMDGKSQSASGVTPLQIINGV